MPPVTGGVLENPARARLMDCLSRFVMATRVHQGKTQRLDLLPTGAPRIVFRWLGGDTADLYLAGPRTRARYKLGVPAQSAMTVEFLPGGALPFLGVPLRGLVDRVVALADIWPEPVVERLVARMVGAASDAARIEVLHAVLGERLAKASRTECRLAEKVCGLLHPDGDASAMPGSRRPGASPRNLRRDFATAVGLSPKRFARVARFRRAAALVEQGGEALSSIAIEAGYFDQAHLSADFRSFAGLSATEFRRPEARDALASACATRHAGVASHQ